MTEPITLLLYPDNTDGADVTFRRVIECVDAAEKSIGIHMFVWRSDEIGNSIAKSVLAAADRGVKVHIIKDTDAFRYERIEMNRKSLFNKKLSLYKRLAYKLIAPTFPDTYVEDSFSSELGDRLMNHSNVTVTWVHHTHSKYYVFDGKVMITGSINIEERHRKYRDYMVELQGEDLIERFKKRLEGKIAFEASRDIDFILNRMENETANFEIKPQMLKLLSEAKGSIYIEMAYIGDPDISREIIQASKRGADVRMLFSEAANIGNDINYKSMHDIYSQCDITVFLSPKMIHSKLMLIDDKVTILGSANISVFSMQKGVELDIVVQNQPLFLDSLKQEIERRINDSEQLSDTRQLTDYNSLIALCQQIHQKIT